MGCNTVVDLESVAMLPEDGENSVVRLGEEDPVRSGSAMSCSRETYVVGEELMEQEKILAGSPDQQVSRNLDFIPVRLMKSGQ